MRCSVQDGAGSGGRRLGTEIQHGLVFLSDWPFCHLIPEAQALGTIVSTGRVQRRKKTRLLPLCDTLGTSASSQQRTQNEHSLFPFPDT